MKNIYCLLLLVVGCFYARDMQRPEEGDTFSITSEDFIYRNYRIVKDIVSDIDETVYTKGKVLLRNIRLIGKIALNMIIDGALVSYRENVDTVYAKREIINIKNITQLV